MIDLAAKVKIVREMACERMHRFPGVGFESLDVDDMNVVQLSSLPEFSIATIVETYAVLMVRGVAPIDALQAIEAHRAKQGAVTFQRPPDLEEYIQARVRIEHGRVQLDHAWVDACIDLCRAHCNLGPRPAQLLERLSIPTVR